MSILVKIFNTKNSLIDKINEKNGERVARLWKETNILFRSSLLLSIIGFSSVFFIVLLGIFITNNIINEMETIILRIYLLTMVIAMFVHFAYMMLVGLIAYEFNNKIIAIIIFISAFLGYLMPILFLIAPIYKYYMGRKIKNEILK